MKKNKRKRKVKRDRLKGKNVKKNGKLGQQKEIELGIRNKKKK